MSNKLKDFLFPSKEKNEFLTSTIEVDNENNEVINQSNNHIQSNSPTILTPKIFSEVEVVAIELLKNKTVIVDLSSTNIEEAKRICDFLNGVTYAINGSVKKIAKLVYIFSPSGK